MRALKGLEKAIPVFYAGPDMCENGWEFDDGGIRFLYELYAKGEAAATPAASPCRCSGTRKKRASSTTSPSEIIRMLNRDFDALARRKLDDLYPEKLRREIDWLNERIYRTVNNGVYRAGFATAQDKYEEAVTELFKTLDWLEKRMAQAQVALRQGLHRGGRALVHYAGALRRGVLLALQMQPAAARRLSRTCGAGRGACTRCRAWRRRST